MKKQIVIITDAAIPWFTGTSINPLWRALYLARNGDDVTLYLPWIDTKSQSKLFPANMIFQTEEEQKCYIYKWINSEEPINGFNITFYPAFYNGWMPAIFPKYRLNQFISDYDILIIEEPEHILMFQALSFFRSKKKAAKVVGIIHTNGQYYVSSGLPQCLAKISSYVLYLFNNFIIKNHCQSSIRLSGVLPPYANSIVNNVNGVSDEYFHRKKGSAFQKNAYFIGKLIWFKGFKELIDLCRDADFREIDIYGKGQDQHAIAAYGISQGINLNFKGVSLAPASDLADYKLFINPSISEVLCTATMEALAMNKFVIIPKHPSNEFFYPFANCLTYENSNDFKRAILYAIRHEPNLDDSKLLDLSWQKATERLIQVI